MSDSTRYFDAKSLDTNKNYNIFIGGRGNGKSIYLELAKNLKHLEILIKQNHTEVEDLELDISDGAPVVYIHYSRPKKEFSKLCFKFEDDPLNLYRRILDDILDTAFVSNNANMI